MLQQGSRYRWKCCLPSVTSLLQRPLGPSRPGCPRAVKLVKNGTLKTYPGYPHGMLTTHADVLNPDLLAFIQS